MLLVELKAYELDLWKAAVLRQQLRESFEREWAWKRTESVIVGGDT
jgi:hypothetical protein